MVTTIGTESTLEDLLTHLTQLDFDAAAAYQAAVRRFAEQQPPTQPAAAP